MTEHRAYHDRDRGGRVVGRREAVRRLGVDGAVWKAADRRFPVRIPRSWFDRIRQADDPLGRQALPDASELVDDPGDLPDPVGEQAHRPVPWVVRKHDDRVLLLLTRRCHLYCRYCFRRDQHGGPEEPTPAELERAIDYARQSGAREVILSGGDPLMLRDERLLGVIDALRPAVPVVRIHTRAPITAPERVTPALLEGLRARTPIWVVVHVNHARELSEPVRAALVALVDAGVPVLNQAVLLRGVNDDASVLARLCEELVALRVFPYYLHHTDPAPGNAAFRVEIERGLAIWRELAGRVSGVALPRYMIDPPDGSGKIPVEEWVRRAGTARSTDSWGAPKPTAEERWPPAEPLAGTTT